MRQAAAGRAPRFGGGAATASAAGMTGAAASRAPHAPPTMRRFGSRRRIDAFSSALLDPAHVPTSRARRLTTRGEGQVRADRGTGRWAEEKEASTQASMAGRGWREARAGLRRREGNKQARCTNRALKSKIGLA